MALVCIAEPVEETRELLERLVSRMGHEPIPPHQFIAADAVLFEPTSTLGLTLARRAVRHNPEAALIAVSADPGSDAAERALPGSLVHHLDQPFAPDDVARVLGDALAA